MVKYPFPRARILMLSIIALSAFGCSKGSETSDSAGKRLFGISYQTLNNPFFIDLTDGMRPVVEAHGDSLEERSADWRSYKQKNDVSDFVFKGVAAIFLNPVNWEGVKGSLEQAKRREIPVIIVDAPVKDMDLVLSVVASDNDKAGRLAAEALVKTCRPARIAILHLFTNKACIDRVAGFTEVISRYPDMEILDTQEGGGNTEDARPVMSDLIARFPDLNAVFAINDPSAIGAISALESVNKLSQVTVVSVDGSREAMAAIKSGKLLSTSAQFPKEIGRAAAEVAYRHLAGEPVEKEIIVRVELITKENVDEYLAAASPKAD